MLLAIDAHMMLFIRQVKVNQLRRSPFSAFGNAVKNLGNAISSNISIFTARCVNIKKKFLESLYGIEFQPISAWKRFEFLSPQDFCILL
jgi:hypothetical protein